MTALLRRHKSPSLATTSSFSAISLFCLKQSLHVWIDLSSVDLSNISLACSIINQSDGRITVGMIIAPDQLSEVINGYQFSGVALVVYFYTRLAV